jgi:hypothetical protein
VTSRSFQFCGAPLLEPSSVGAFGRAPTGAGEGVGALPKWPCMERPLHLVVYGESFEVTSRDTKLLSSTERSTQEKVIVRTQNWQVWSDRSDLWVPPVRPVWSMSTKYSLDFTIGYVSSSRLRFICGMPKSEPG